MSISIAHLRRWKNVEYPIAVALMPPTLARG